MGARKILFSEFLHYIMFSFQQQQQKRDMKKSVADTQGKIISIEIIFDEDLILSLLNKDFKSTILNMFKELRKSMPK